MYLKKENREFFGPNLQPGRSAGNTRLPSETMDDQKEVQSAEEDHLSIACHLMFSEQPVRPEHDGGPN
jgi:hypothetical protein